MTNEIGITASLHISWNQLRAQFIASLPRCICSLNHISLPRCTCIIDGITASCIYGTREKIHMYESIILYYQTPPPTTDFETLSTKFKTKPLRKKRLVYRTLSNPHMQNPPLKSTSSPGTSG